MLEIIDTKKRIDYLLSYKTQKRKMIQEKFKTKREFKNKYPSGLYVCASCKSLSQDPYYCRNCGYRADGILKTMNNGYIYEIEETGETAEIFTPLERMK